MIEGMAKAGNGELKVTVRAKESKLERRIGLMLEFCKVGIGI